MASTSEHEDGKKQIEVIQWGNEKPLVEEALSADSKELLEVAKALEGGEKTVEEVVETLSPQSLEELVCLRVSLLNPKLMWELWNHPKTKGLVSLQYYVTSIHNVEELYLQHKRHKRDFKERRTGEEQETLRPLTLSEFQQGFDAFLRHRQQSESYGWNDNQKVGVENEYEWRLKALRASKRVWPEQLQSTLMDVYAESAYETFRFMELSEEEEKQYGCISFADEPPARPTKNLIRRYALPPEIWEPDVYDVRPQVASWNSPPGAPPARLVVKKVGEESVTRWSQPLKPPIGRDWLKKAAEGKMKNDHSIVDKETFLKNFQTFTSGIFEGWKKWDHLIVLGGSVVASLMPIPSKYAEDPKGYFHKQLPYANSDVDLYCYGTTQDKFASLVGELYEHFKSLPGNEVIAVRTEWTVTFCNKWPRRKVQIILGVWDTKEEVLYEPDISPTCVAFDGKTVWASHRARLSYNLRWLMPSYRLNMERRHPEYEERLYKYSRRGFYIASKELGKKLSIYYVLQAMARLAEHRTVCGRTQVWGMRLLLTAYQFSFLETNVDIFLPETAVEQGELPYGPDVDIKKIREHLKTEGTERSNYGISSYECKYKEMEDLSAKTLKEEIRLRSLYKKPSFATSNPDANDTLVPQYHHYHGKIKLRWVMEDAELYPLNEFLLEAQEEDEHKRPPKIFTEFKFE